MKNKSYRQEVTNCICIDKIISSILIRITYRDLHSFQGRPKNKNTISKQNNTTTQSIKTVTRVIKKPPETFKISEE